MTAGKFSLNPRKEHPSWVENPLPCPTNPRGILVAASGGLICHALHTYDERRRIITTDFVISNPITGKYRELPTLVHFKPGYCADVSMVTMIVQQGVLHQLWVDSYLRCVYDCFATKQVMEKRIQNVRNSGQTFFSLPNGWFTFGLGSAMQQLTFFGSKVMGGTGKLELADINDFSLTLASHDSEEFCGGPPLVLLGKLVLVLADGLQKRVCATSYDEEERKFHVGETLFRFKVKPKHTYAFAAAGDIFYVAMMPDGGGAKQGILFRLDSSGSILSEELVPEPDFQFFIQPIFVESISLADPLIGVDSGGMSSTDWESLDVLPFVEEDEDEDEVFQVQIEEEGEGDEWLAFVRRIDDDEILQFTQGGNGWMEEGEGASSC